MLIPIHFSSLFPKMLMFTLAISHLTFQFTLIHGPNIPGSYAILFFTASDFTFTKSTTECHFCFFPAASFLLEVLVIALCSSPVAYWTPSNLGDSPYGVISFCLFILSLWFSRQEHWSGVLFLPPLDHVLSELFTLSYLSLVALQGMLIASLSYANSLCCDKVMI